MKRGFRVGLIVFGIVVFTLFFLRLISPSEIDDIHPNWMCEGGYVEKSDVLWVAPIYENVPISENKTWCEEILSMNKTLGMHGIYHSYHEFEYFVNESDLIRGMDIFEECFGYKPILFKPPYLRLSLENKKMIERNNLTLKWLWNQNIHKVYHCENTGVFPNRFHDIF